MTLGELKEAIKQQVARYNPELEQNLVRFINQIIRFICDFYNFSFLSQTIEFLITAGQQTYALPSNFKDDIQFVLLKDGKYKELPIVVDQKIIKQYTLEEIGEPEVIVLGKTMFSVFPKPNKDYVARMTYYAYFDPLVNDSDSNYLTEKEADLVISGVMAEVHKFLFEYEQANVFTQEFNNKLLLLKRRDVTYRLPTEMTLGVTTDVKKISG